MLSSKKISDNYPILGIVGCGNIGGRQAANFLARGYSVYVFDIDRERAAKLKSIGARVTNSCAELAKCSEVIFTSLPTPADVIAAVLEGEDNLSQEVREGSIYIDLTTNSPETVLRLHKAMKKLGVEMLDAPFNDRPVGITGKEDMGLAVLASGSRETFDRVEPILQLAAERVLYCGEISSGTRCKLIHNAVNAIAVQATTEGITLGLTEGIPLETLWDVLRLGAFARNPGDIHGLPHYWFSRRCDDPSQHPAFTVKLLHKDLRLALAMANKRDLQFPHLSLTVKDYEEAERRDWSHYATTKVRCLQEERSRVEAKGNLSVTSNTDQKTRGLAFQENSKFSFYAVLMLVLASNLLQLGLHWVLGSHH